MERLQRILAARGISSRRAAEELIKSGRVSVDGKIVSELGTKADLEQDPKKREALYSEIQKIYSDAAPIASIAYLGATAGWRSNVDGFFIDGLSYYRFEDVKFTK